VRFGIQQLRGNYELALFLSPSIDPLTGALLVRYLGKQQGRGR
jgi:hypothetical protein